MNTAPMQNMNMMAQQQHSAANLLQQLTAHYRNQQANVPQGWWQSVQPQERAASAQQLCTHIQLLKADGNQMDAIRQAITTETQMFKQAQSKEQYANHIRSQLVRMTQLRQQRAQGMQNNLNNGMNPGQMGMMGQGARPNPQQQFPQGFPNAQLQRPMQVSPIPMSQNTSSMGMAGTNGVNFQQGPNTPQPNMQPPPSQTPQQGLQVDNATINAITQKLMATARPEVINKFRQEVEAWPQERRAALMAKNIDPLLMRFRHQAELLVRNNKLGLNNLQGGQAANQNGAMQQPGQPTPQMNLNQRQPNQEFDFNAITNQQIEALRVQDQGQTVVPASNNANTAQMVGFPGQNGQPGQVPNPAMAGRQAQLAAFNMQRQQAQAQAQAQARAQQLQQQQAQAQAQAAQRNANPMLQGQVGGLNLPPGAQAQQSPAMPLLTRPMAPPGQPAPTTPQQRPQAHVPQMTPQGQQQFDPQVATQLMREVHQKAFNLGQPLTEQVRMQMMPPDMPPQIKTQLLKVPEAQFRTMLTAYLSSMRQRNAVPNGAFPAGQPPPGQPNMVMNTAQALQMGLQGQMMNAGNMGRPPGMPMGQQTSNGVPGQQMSVGPRPGIPQPQQQQRLHAAQQLLQQNPGIITATDNNPFPSAVLTAQVKQNLPPDIRSWAQLKNWANQNPALMPNLDTQKLLLLQVLQFQDNYIRQKQGMAGMPAPQQPNGTGPMPPQAQMMPGQVPNRTPQQPLNMPSLDSIQVTPQEMQLFRSKLPAPQQNVSDQQLRHYIQTQKLNAAKKQQQQQQQQMMMNMQAQRGLSNQGQPAMPAQGPAVSRPQPAHPPPAQATPQHKPPTKPPPSKGAQANEQVNMNKGVKRPNEESAEASNEAPGANAAPQAPAMVPTRSQGGISKLTPEQISKLPPNQQAQYRNHLLIAQDASNKSQQPGMPAEIMAKMQTPEMQQKYRSMIMEEEQKVPKGQPIQVSPEARAQLQQMVREQLPRLRKIEHALRLFICFEGAHTENVARDIMRARTLLLRNLNPQSGNLHDELTMNEEVFRNTVRHVLQFVAKIMSRFSGQQSQGNAAQQNRPQPDAQAQVTRPPQLNAANLKIVEQQNRQSKAPQAPTTDRPPFPLGGQSPAGAPTYFEGAPKLEKLTLPEVKKRRLDSTSQTPGAKSSPRLGTGKGSPELRKHAPTDRTIEQKPTFKCKSADCDYSTRGFDTQPELEAHTKEAHAKIDDPLQFTLDAMADILDVDPKTSRSRVEPATVGRATKPATASSRAVPPTVKSVPTPSVPPSATTPAAPQAVATPMTRVPTQSGIKSSPSTSLLKTPQTAAKVATPSTGAPAKATPSSITRPPKDTEFVVPAEAQKDEEGQPFAPLSLLDLSYDDIYGVLDTNMPFTVLDLKDEDTSWALRDPSPMNTPDSSSKDTPSTRQSDISENDNLQINLDIKDVDMPDGWLAALSGDPLPLDVQLSDDLQTLGVTLPPMNEEDTMLFYSDSYMTDLDSIDMKILDMPTLDPSMLGTA